MKRNAKLLAIAVLLLGAGISVGYRWRDSYPPEPADRILSQDAAAEAARIGEAMGKVRQLASLATQFANDRGGKLPRSLDELRTMPGADDELFRSPFAAEKGATWCELHSPGKELFSISSSSTEPLISVTQLRDDESRIVAFVDGHVEQMRELDFIRWRISQGELTAGRQSEAGTEKPKSPDGNDAP